MQSICIIWWINGRSLSYTWVGILHILHTWIAQLNRNLPGRIVGDCVQPFAMAIVLRRHRECTRANTITCMQIFAMGMRRHTDYYCLIKLCRLKCVPAGVFSCETAVSIGAAKQLQLYYTTFRLVGEHKSTKLTIHEMFANYERDILFGLMVYSYDFRIRIIITINLFRKIHRPVVRISFRST